MTSPEATHQTLSRELSVFLVQFSIGLHKVGTYPPQHPIVAEAVQSVYAHLGPLLAERQMMSLGVARDQLIVEGAATDPDNAVLADLARSLHQHQIGAIRLQRGLPVGELHDLMVLLNTEAGRGRVALGLRPPEELDRWNAIEIVPLTFEELQLSSGETEEGARGKPSQLWLGLAAAAMRETGTEGDVEDVGPEAIAAAIEANAGDQSYDQVIVGYLSQLGRELKLRGGAEARQMQEQVAQLLQALDVQTLKRLLELGGDHAVRNRMLADFSASLPVQAVLDLVRAASEASGQTVSHSLIRMLSKLANHADAGSTMVGPHADDGFRDSVQALLDDWSLEDPNPETYTAVLQHLTLTESAGEDSAATDPAEDAARLVQMALELDALGETATHAVDTMLEAGRFSELLGLLDEAPEGATGPAAVWDHLASPECVRLLLAHDDQDLEGVQRVLERLGDEAAEPLILALASANSRALRHRLLSTLTALGAGVGPVALAYLPDAEWFLQRNLLILIGSLPAWPEGFSPEPYADHEDARVRREAVKLMLQAEDASLREAGVRAGVSDDDASIIRMALTAAINACPVAAHRHVIELMDHEDGDIRILAIRVAGGLDSARAREELLGRTLGRRRWWQRRPRLASSSSEMLASLSALAAAWPDHDAVRPVLDMARQSPDAEIRAAVEGR